VAGPLGGEPVDAACSGRWDEIASEVPGVGLRSNGSLTLATDDAELQLRREAEPVSGSGGQGRVCGRYGAYFCYQVPGQEVNGGDRHYVPGYGRKSYLVAIRRAILLDLRDTGAAA
jgi:hypothetical protein